MSEAPGAAAEAARTCTTCAFSRRDFLTAATAAAVIAALEACDGGLTGPGNFTAVSGGAITVKLSDYPALSAVGGIARVDKGGSPAALVRTGATSFVGVTMVCTHQGSTIGIVSGGFLCPNHGARYNANGTWTGGQVTSSLATFGTTYDAAAGTVTVNRPA